MTPQIFLSSKMRRNALQSERIVARKAVESTELWTCWNWEQHATAGPYPPMDLCLDEVKKSDALILLLSGDLTDNTRQEYELATALSLRRYVFVKSGTLQPHTRNFLNAIQSDITYQKFGNVGELETMVKSSLQADLIRGYRSLSGYSEIGTVTGTTSDATYPRRAS